MYPAFYLQVMHPLYHALKRDGLNAVQRAALATDSLDAGGIARLQREKLARLLRGALARSPYYREVIDAGAAEALYEDQRLRIQDPLRAPVYDRYGCREVTCIAHERPGAKGLVINADRVLIELLDERGRPVPDGDLGSIYVTDLGSHAMPLIRYEIGDLAIAAPPSERQTYPALARVEGRSLDVARSPDGRAVGAPTGPSSSAAGPVFASSRSCRSGWIIRGSSICGILRSPTRISGISARASTRPAGRRSRSSLKRSSRLRRNRTANSAS
jgi:hypothetical protein